MAYARTFENYRPPRRYDDLPFVAADVMESATRDGSYALVEAITLDPVDADPSDPASRDFTTNDATLADGWYIVRWRDGDGATFDADPVYFPPTTGVAFATSADVSARLGRDLTDAEVVQVGSVLVSVASQIAAACDRDDDWAADLDPIPAVFVALSVEKAVQAVVNPLGLAAWSKSLGAFSESATTTRASDGGAVLTDADERRVRAAVYGGSGSARVPSVVDDVLDWADDAQVNDSLSP